MNSSAEKDLEKITIETYDRNAERWSSSHAFRNSPKVYIDKFNKLLPKGSILEVGCGGGRDARDFINLGYDYLGTDASASMVRLAKRNVPEGKFRRLNLYDLGQLNNKFDGFWARAVYLHVPKKRMAEALQALNLRLKLDAIGMMSIKDGDREDFEVRDKNSMHEERLFVYWKKEEIIELLTLNGFKVIEYIYKPESERTNWHIMFIRKVSGAKED